jgi:uncharacterized protein YcfJ
MRKISVTTLAALFAGGSAYGANEIIDYAQVISSRPVIERVTETNQVCDPAPAQQQSSGSNIVAPIVGGVVGGLIGHQIGQGRGQTAATIVGAAGGAVAGSAIANKSNPPPAQQQCRNVQNYRDVVTGYDVVYRYNGRDANVRLPYNPGNTIRVGVSVLPDDRAADAGRGGYNSPQGAYNSPQGGYNSPPPPPPGNPPAPPRY